MTSYVHLLDRICFTSPKFLQMSESLSHFKTSLALQVVAIWFCESSGCLSLLYSSPLNLVIRFVCSHPNLVIRNLKLTMNLIVLNIKSQIDLVVINWTNHDSSRTTQHTCDAAPVDFTATGWTSQHRFEEQVQLCQI